MRRIATVALVAVATVVVAATAAEPRTAQAAAPYSPRVQVMVVGRMRLLKAPTFVYSRPFSLLLGRRRCAVAGGTPLAALEGARRLGGPSFHVRDYGGCSLRFADASAMYVDRVGLDYARGRDGWVYKVDRRVGTTSAADLSGPFGSGRRLRAGQRVTWFYCRMGLAGCQRTLELGAPVRRVAAGSALGVHVHAYDDLARGRSAAGATVTLAGARFVADAGGNVTVTAPAQPGRHLLYASQPGSIQAVPVEITVT